VLADERAKLAHQPGVLAQRELGIDPILEGSQP
jgi:hypothetical protein